MKGNTHYALSVRIQKTLVFYKTCSGNHMQCNKNSRENNSKSKMKYIILLFSKYTYVSIQGIMSDFSRCRIFQFKVSPLDSHKMVWTQKLRWRVHVAVPDETDIPKHTVNFSTISCTIDNGRGHVSVLGLWKCPVLESYACSWRKRLPWLKEQIDLVW
jgi:hypothetical protein